MKGWQALPAQRCGGCKYFYRHYGRTGRGRYVPLWCGHCVHPQLKNRRIEESCSNWRPRQEEAPRDP